MDENVAQASVATDEIAPVVVWHPRAEEYRKALLKRLPGVPVEARSGSGRQPHPSNARALLAWGLPPGALRQLPRLEWIQSTGAGVDDLLARDDLDESIALTRSIGRFGTQVAEYTVGYLLHGLLRIEDYRRSQDRAQWKPLPRPLLADRQVGVLGLGILGQSIATRVAAFGAEVVGVCRRARPVSSVRQVIEASRWRDVLSLSDALVLALPLTDETRGLINAEALAQLPEGAMLINVSRGGLIDEEALIESLRSGHLGAAVLDVFASEPLPPESPLWTEPRAWITPHVAAPSEIEPIADEFAANYQRFIDGDELANEIDRDRGY